MPGDDPLLLVGEVHTLDEARPTARAVLVRRRRIAWVGDDVDQVARGARVVDLGGARIMPAFVNAHTHLTRLGLTLEAMDLSLAESLADCLSAVAAIATVTPHRVVWAGGWDETLWPENRAPSADDLDVAGGGRPVMLSRVDGHCVVVDRTSLSVLPIARSRGVERGPDGRPTGLLRQEAAQVAQRWFTGEMPDSVLAQARAAAADHLAQLGVASAHEMGGPHRMGPADFDAWRVGDWPIEVIPYWGDIDLEFAVERGLRRVGGSLLLDGTIGSHSAALLEPYLDRAGSGQLYRDSAELAEFAVQASHRGMQVALHAIGDRAVEQAITVFEAVAEEVGVAQMRRLAHRIEYAALIRREQMLRVAALGLIVVTQPATDLQLGLEGRSYEQRLGVARARHANPLGALADHQVTVAFGSDGVNDLDPWRSVDTACAAREAARPLTRAQSIRAATVGGRLAAHQANVGVLRAGQRADIAAFESVDDPVARRCVLTMVAGKVVHAGGRVDAGAELSP